MAFTIEILKYVASNFIGFLIGAGSSFIVWYYLFRKVVPKIEFSDKVSRILREDSPPKHNYRIKYQNKGKRTVIDVEIKVKLRVKGLFKNRPSTWHTVSIPTARYEIPILKPQNYGGQIVNFGITECDFFTGNLVDEEIKNKYQNKTLTLEDVLNIGKQNELSVIISGFDEFSGARKIFVSKFYRITDIEAGQFHKDTLQIKRKEKTRTANNV